MTRQSGHLPGESDAQRHLGRVLLRRIPRRARSDHVARPPRRLAGDGRGRLRDGQDRLRDRAGPDRRDVSLAGHHAHRREGWRRGVSGAAVRTAATAPVPGHPRGPSRHGLDRHEHGRQHDGAGQRRNAPRAQGHEGAAGAQPGPREREQRPDPVPGDQHLGGDGDPRRDLRLPGPAGRRRPHRHLLSVPDRDLLQHPRRVTGDRDGSAPEALGPGGSRLPGRHDRAARRPRRLLREPRARRDGGALGAARQLRDLRRDHRLHDRGGGAPAAPLRDLRRGREGGVRGGGDDHPLPGGDAGRDRRVPGQRRDGPATRQPAQPGGDDRVGHALRRRPANGADEAAQSEAAPVA